MTKQWGPPTWFFLHSFVEKIPESDYIELKDEMCKIILKICHNLPCIECTKHAKLYTKNGLNSKTLDTKEKLRQYLFTFHDTVNIRLKKEKFTDYDKYKSANLVLIYNHFKSHYLKYNDYKRGFIDTMVKNKILKMTDKFIIEHHKKFIN